MDDATVNLLLAKILEGLRQAADCQLKLVALERLLEKKNPALCRGWRREIETLRDLGAFTITQSALDSLREKLLLE